MQDLKLITIYDIHASSVQYSFTTRANLRPIARLIERGVHMNNLIRPVDT